MSNPPRQFWKWSYEQGDQKLQQEEQEHGLWSKFDFLWRKRMSMGGSNK
jgi:hypothetical protein